MTKEIDFNIYKEQRKALVNAIAEYTQAKPVYLGPPTFSYKIDTIIVNRDGVVIFPDVPEQEFEMQLFMRFMVERGYDMIYGTGGGTAAAGTDETVEAEPETDEAETAPAELLTISMPREMFSDAALDNLLRLIDSKAELIKTALGTDDLRIGIGDDAVRFPWFTDASPDAVQAYTHFVSALCDMAIHAKRVNAVEKEVDNQKYAFRCFLLRLGFIGEEYKKERKILLRNLTGSSAFRNGGAQV